MGIKEHEQKRDPSRGQEPGGKRTRKSRGNPLFVIQQHDASSLHYDFRLEVGGVLKSWAVPKGPSADPREKRLAVPTEDHPLEYAKFEGVNPQGDHGGGSVLVWDRGDYENLTKKDGKRIAMDRALEQGHAVIELHGEKIAGGYALQRTGKGKRARWLLMKLPDEADDARRKPASSEPGSAARGRREIAGKGKE